MTKITDQLPGPRVTEIQQARENLGPGVLMTPVWQCRTSSFKDLLGAQTEIFCKLELFQYAGSFKARGALLSMLNLSDQQQRKGVVAASAGNHAIAVAYAAQRLDIPATVVMPKTASSVRVDRCKHYGAKVVLVDDIMQVFALADNLQAEQDLSMIHPFEGPTIALGTATVGLELCQQVDKLDAVVIPIGGGGLCGGIAALVKQLQPQCKIYGVEPEGANVMYRSFAAGKPVSIERVTSIADSLGAPYAMPYSFSLCRAYIDDLVLVDDDSLCRAMAILFNELKLAVEPAAAASLAAILGPLKDRIRNKRIGLIICGSNIDIDRFSQYVQRGVELNLAS